MMRKLAAVCSIFFCCVMAPYAHAETALFASTPGEDEVQLAPDLLSADATTALSSIDENAWQPAVACLSPSSWPKLTNPYATWISNTYENEATGTNSWRWFRRLITIPVGASGFSAVVTWTADNAGVVYINRALLGQDGEVFGNYYDNEEWSTVEAYPVDGSLLREGENELLFLVRNYGTQTHNPTGLIYEFAITGEGVWTNFPDVLPGHWAYDEVAACFQVGIVKGYPDGLYHPEYALKRSQMAVFIARAKAGGDARVPDGPPTPTFPDVLNTGYGEYGTDPYWAYNYIEYCAAHGIVKGYWDGTYQPENDIDRGQMAVFIARAKAGSDAAVPEPTSGPTFSDVPVDFWAYKYIEYCATQGIVQGYWDGYHPELIVTRDQMAVFIARAFGLLP